MRHSLTTCIALWRKDLRANGMLLLVVGAVVCVAGGLSLVAAWRSTIVFLHLKVCPIGATFLLATGMFTTEAAHGTQVFFHSLPAPRRRVLAARALLSLLLLALILLITLLVCRFLIVTAPELAREQIGPELVKPRELALLVLNWASIFALMSLGVLLLTAPCSLVLSSPWPARTLTAAAAAVVLIAGATVNDLFDFSSNFQVSEVAIPDWALCLYIAGVVAGGYVVAWRMHESIAPLEPAHRARAIAKRWLLVTFCCLAAFLLVNLRFPDMPVTCTRQLKEVATLGNDLVFNATAMMAGRETYNRLWAVDADTGKAMYLRRGCEPRRLKGKSVSYRPPGSISWIEEFRWIARPVRRALNLKTGRDMPLRLSPALLTAIKRGQPLRSIHTHQLSGNAYAEVQRQAGFLVDEYNPQRRTSFLYRRGDRRPTELLLPKRLFQPIAWNAEGTALYLSTWPKRDTASSEPSFEQVPASARGYEVGKLDVATLKYQRISKAHRRTRTDASWSDGALPGHVASVVSPDDRLLCFWARGGPPEDERWDLVVAKTDGSAERVIACPLSFQVGWPVWSPDSSRFIALSSPGEPPLWKLFYWRISLPSLRSFSVDLSRGRKPEVWHEVPFSPNDYDLQGEGEQGLPKKRWLPGATFQVDHPVWASDSRRVALTVAEGGCLNLQLQEKGQNWLRTRLSVCVVDLDRWETSWTEIQKTDYDEWAPMDSPGYLDQQKRPEVMALTWNSQGQVICVMNDGRVIAVDPGTSTVRPLLQPGGNPR